MIPSKHSHFIVINSTCTFQRKKYTAITEEVELKLHHIVNCLKVIIQNIGGKNILDTITQA